MQKWKPIFHLKNSQLIKKEDGVTLLELLASIALLSIIIMLVGSVHMFGQRQYIKQSHDASQANELAAGISANVSTKSPSGMPYFSSIALAATTARIYLLIAFPPSVALALASMQ